MAATDQATVSVPRLIKTDDELGTVGMTKETDPTKCLVDSDERTKPIGLVEKPDSTRSPTHDPNDTNLPITATETGPMENSNDGEGAIDETSRSSIIAEETQTATSSIDNKDMIGEAGISEVTQYSLPPSDIEVRHASRRATPWGWASEDVWGTSWRETQDEEDDDEGSWHFTDEEKDEKDANESEDMENETDPNRLHEYIRELKDELDEVEQIRDRLVSERDKYENPYYFGPFWMREKLVMVHELLQGCTLTLPDWNNLLVQWPLVNEFLMKRECVFLPVNHIPNPEILAEMKCELLTFAAASLIWKTFFEPVLLGATTAERSVLQKLEGGIKGLEFPLHPKAVNRWRAYTFRAMAASKNYDEGIAQECDHASDLIMQMYKIAGYSEEDRTGESGFLWSLREGVLKPAAELATRIRGSEDEFFWNWETPGPMMKKSDLKNFEVLDFKWHCTMVNDYRHFSELSDDDTLGECLFSVFPALHKKGKDGESDTVVSRGWAVVILHDHLSNWCGVDAKDPPIFEYEDE